MPTMHRIRVAFWLFLRLSAPIVGVVVVMTAFHLGGFRYAAVVLGALALAWFAAWRESADLREKMNGHGKGGDSDVP